MPRPVLLLDVDGVLNPYGTAECPAVWTDDLHTPEARTWSTARWQPTLLIPITPATGLTREAVNRALAWAQQAGVRI